jgi:SAM-dependent methyltransferase
MSALKPDKSWQLGRPRSLSYRLYDGARRRLNGRITRHLTRIALARGGVVIEAGSGTGFATGLLAENPAVSLSIAVDYDLEALQEGRRANPHLCAVVADVHHLPFRDGCAQLVWNSSTIEHLPDPARVAIEMGRVTRAGGVVYIGVPYRRGALFFQRFIAQSAVGVWLGTVYGRGEVEAWLNGAACRPLGAWTYFGTFFLGVWGEKQA